MEKVNNIINILIKNTLVNLNKAMVSINKDSNMILERDLALAHIKDLQSLSLLNRYQTKVMEQVKENTIRNDFVEAKRNLQKILKEV